MSLQPIATALSTTLSTSTTTETTTQWITRWAFPQVTISCALPDLASASYPYTWMTATGEALELALSSYSSATAQSTAAATRTISPTTLPGCPALSSTAITTDLESNNDTATSSTTTAAAAAVLTTISLPVTSLSLSAQQPGSSVYVPASTNTDIDAATAMTMDNGTNSPTNTFAPSVTNPLASPSPITTTATTNDNGTHNVSDAYTTAAVTVTATESVYIFVSDGSTVLSSMDFRATNSASSSSLATSSSSSSTPRADQENDPTTTMNTNTNTNTNIDLSLNVDQTQERHSPSSSSPESRSRRGTTLTRVRRQSSRPFSPISKSHVLN